MISTLYTEDLTDTTTYTYFSDIELSTTEANFLNLTGKGQKVQLALYDILLPLIGAIVILLNFTVVISSGLIIKKGSLQPIATYLFLGNVALSDLVTAFALLLGNLIPKDNRTQLTCAFSLGLIVSCTIVSIYSVGLIAIDRYLYIVHGLKYQRWVYPIRARIFIGLTWVIGCVIGFLPVMGWAGNTYNGRQCWFIKLVPPKLIIMTCLIGVLPIIVVVVLYSIILYYAIKKVIQLKNAGKETKNEHDLRIFRGKVEAPETNESQREKNFFKRIFKKSEKTEKNSPSKGKAVKVVLFTTGSFIITWVPYFVASFLYVQCDASLTPKRCKNLEILIASPLALLGFCNSFLNPIIYAWWHTGFRNFVKKILCKKNKNTPKSMATTSSSVTKSSTKGSANNENEIPSIDAGMVNIDLN